MTVISFSLSKRLVLGVIATVVVGHQPDSSRHWSYSKGALSHLFMSRKEIWAFLDVAQLCRHFYPVESKQGFFVQRGDFEHIDALFEGASENLPQCLANRLVWMARDP
jgi:hypothetical protein